MTRCRGQCSLLSRPAARGMPVHRVSFHHVDGHMHRTLRIVPPTALRPCNVLSQLWRLQPHRSLVHFFPWTSLLRPSNRNSEGTTQHLVEILTDTSTLQERIPDDCVQQVHANHLARSNVLESKFSSSLPSTLRLTLVHEPLTIRC